MNLKVGPLLYELFFTIFCKKPHQIDVSHGKLSMDALRNVHVCNAGNFSWQYIFTI